MNQQQTKDFKKIDIGQVAGTHWTCFYVKDKKFYYLGLIGGSRIKFLRSELPKSITFHKYSFHDIMVDFLEHIVYTSSI